MTAHWVEAGSHFVAKEGRRRKISLLQREDGTWSAAVHGCFSTYGVTAGNAIRNACAPIDEAKARESIDEYVAHRSGALPNGDYIASITRRHEANMAAFIADALAHGEDVDPRIIASHSKRLTS